MFYLCSILALSIMEHIFYFGSETPNDFGMIIDILHCKLNMRFSLNRCLNQCLLLEIEVGLYCYLLCARIRSLLWLIVI